jgi:hypothetical protein
MPQTGTETIFAAGALVAYAVAETAQPATPVTAPAVAWNDLGYISDSGLDFAYGDEQVAVGAWQAASPVRRGKTGDELTVGMNMLQWNELTLPVAFGGGVVVAEAGPQYRYRFPAATDGLVERAFLFRWIDGARNFQMWVPRAVRTNPTETTLARTAVAQLPLGITALQPNTGGARIGEILTDDAQWIV